MVMVPKFNDSGTSFKGLVQYLIHDAGHKLTAERVAWTHTLNLCNDNISSAVHEMMMTAEAAPFLKEAAGIKNTAPVEKPVKHLSLNWHPSESVSRVDMIAAAESFLAHMGWRCQCIIICHTDRPHPHIHLALSALDFQTGRKLDDSLEWKRAQAWALAYEQSRGDKIFCTERLKPANDREQAPPRNIWSILEEGYRAHMRVETARLAELPELNQFRRDANNLEWRALKEIQKDERLGFITGGKAAYGALRKQVYRDVSKVFRPEWKAFYAAERAHRASGATDKATLAEARADLIARQKEAYETGRDQAMADLRASRDAEYSQILSRQKEERAALVGEQERGQSSIERLRDMAATSPVTQEPDADQSERQPRREPSIPSGGTARANRLLWASGGAGMVSQQQAAMRWLQQIARQAENAPSAASNSNLTPAQARLYGMKRAASVGKERATPRGKDGFGIEPD